MALQGSNCKWGSCIGMHVTPPPGSPAKPATSANSCCMYSCWHAVRALLPLLASGPTKQVGVRSPALLLLLLPLLLLTCCVQRPTNLHNNTMAPARQSISRRQLHIPMASTFKELTCKVLGNRQQPPITKQQGQSNKNMICWPPYGVKGVEVPAAFYSNTLEFHFPRRVPPPPRPPAAPPFVHAQHLTIPIPFPSLTVC